MMTPRSLSRDEVRDVDRRALEEYGRPGGVFVGSAGRGAAEVAGGVRCGAPRGTSAGDTGRLHDAPVHTNTRTMSRKWPTRIAR